MSTHKRWTPDALQSVLATKHGLHRLSWTKDAACDGASPELFFPASSFGWDAQAAISLCRGCPVRVLCAARALDLREEYGIHAGVFLAPGRVTRGRKTLKKIAGQNVSPDESMEEAA